MKKDFDNLVLNYLSIYNESSYYRDIGDEYQPYPSDIYDHEDRIADMKKAAADDEAADNSPKICPTCESDMYDGECANCGHEEVNDNDDEMKSGKEYGESEYGESEYGDHYHNDADSPRNNYGHSFKDGDYPDDVDDFNKSEDCPECKNEGCVDKNGHCHYCNPEDEEPESGREY